MPPQSARIALEFTLPEEADAAQEERLAEALRILARLSLEYGASITISPEPIAQQGRETEGK